MLSNVLALNYVQLQMSRLYPQGDEALAAAKTRSYITWRIAHSAARLEQSPRYEKPSIELDF